MNPKLKACLLYSARNAVNAVLTNAALMAMFPATFHLHSAAGFLALAKGIGAAVAAREFVVWGPVILKWSSTNGGPASTP